MIDKKNATRLAFVALVTAATTGLLLYPASPEAPVEMSALVPADVEQGMRGMGFVLEPLPDDMSQFVRVELSGAIAEAERSSVGQQNPSVAALALFWDTASQGNETSAGDSAGRVVYVLVFDGLDLYPFGPWSDTPDDSPVVHHELVVLVDADTGEFVLSTTFR